jgi:hypothetical protein
MHTEDQHHQVAEPHEAGRRLRVLAEARGARERMCGKHMAVLCISNALRGVAIAVAITIGLGLVGLPMVQRSRHVIVDCGSISDRIVRHGRRGCGRGHGCSRLVVAETRSWLPSACVGRGQLLYRSGLLGMERGINDARKRRLGERKGRTQAATWP